MWRKLYRWPLLIAFLLAGVVLTVLFLHRELAPGSLASRIEQTWLAGIARLFGVRIRVHGKPLTQGGLMVANHLCWLDIPVIGSLTPVHFLAKQEVRNMPVVGWLATRAGTRYIHRGNRQSASQATTEITRVLQKGHNALVFAEGGTSNGCIRRFHARTLQSAIDAGAMIQPVAIFYPAGNKPAEPSGLDSATLFFGEMSAGQSLDRIMRSPAIDAEVFFLPPFSSEGKTRDQLARHAWRAVKEKLDAFTQC